MIKTCHGCGVQKDTDQREVYPYPESGGFCTDTITPMFWIDVEPNEGGLWRRVNICHECFHKLDPDAWISELCWVRIAPITPFAELPLMEIEP